PAPAAGRLFVCPLSVQQTQRSVAGDCSHRRDLGLCCPHSPGRCLLENAASSRSLLAAHVLRFSRIPYTAAASCGRGASFPVSQRERSSAAELVCPRLPRKIAVSSLRPLQYRLAPRPRHLPVCDRAEFPPPCSSLVVERGIYSFLRRPCGVRD